MFLITIARLPVKCSVLALFVPYHCLGSLPNLSFPTSTLCDLWSQFVQAQVIYILLLRVKIPPRGDLHILDLVSGCHGPVLFNYYQSGPSLMEVP
jgi:hypothetical protein